MVWSAGPDGKIDPTDARQLRRQQGQHPELAMNMSVECRVSSVESRSRCARRYSLSPRHLVTRHSTAFTLIEMLVVISILGILAALTVPALKNFGKSDANISASRQMLDDVARARQLAISQRTTVYMVFVPTNFWMDHSGTYAHWWNSLTPARQCRHQSVRQAIERLQLCRLRRDGRPAGTAPGIISRRGRRCPTARSSPQWKFYQPDPAFPIQRSNRSHNRSILDLSRLLTPTPFRFPRKRTLPPSAPIFTCLTSRSIISAS